MAKVCVVVADRCIGGIQKMGQVLAVNLRHSTGLAVLEDKGRYNHVKNLQTHTTFPRRLAFIKGNLGTRLKQALGLAIHLHKNDPDVLLSLGYSTGVIAYIARMIISPGTIQIFGVRNSVRELENRARTSIIIRMLPLAIRSCSSVITISRGIKKELSKLDFKTSKIAAIHNGLDLKSIQMKAEEQTSLTNISEGKKILINVGRLSPQKNQRLLIEAFHIASKDNDHQCVIVGEGDERAELAALIRNLDLEDRVHLTGALENPFPLMKAAHAFALTSKYEGFGNVLVEAMACGLPCISTQCPHGPAEIIVEGKSGFLVPENDPHILASRIRTLLESPDVCEEMGKNAEMRCLAFSQDRMISKYHDHISKLICKAVI